MYHIAKRMKTVCSSHVIEGHEGKCQRLHGHNWVVEIGLSSTELDTINRVVDFSDLGDFLSKIHSEIDHQHLNDVLQEENCTAEFMSKWIYDQFIEAFPSFTDHLVRIWETPDSYAEYKYTNEESVRDKI